MRVQKSKEGLEVPYSILGKVCLYLVVVDNKVMQSQKDAPHNDFQTLLEVKSFKLFNQKSVILNDFQTLYKEHTVQESSPNVLKQVSQGQIHQDAPTIPDRETA